jgi:hypothetical protein
MTSDKTYSTEQRLNTLIAGGVALFGPWTAWTSLANSWAVQGSYNQAWVRSAPGNMAIISVRLAAGSTVDGVTVGTIPSADSAGNNLRPASTVFIPVMTDEERIFTGSNNEDAAFRIDTDGTVHTLGIGGGATFAAVAAGWYPLDTM